MLTNLIVIQLVQIKQIIGTHVLKKKKQHIQKM